MFIFSHFLSILSLAHSSNSHSSPQSIAYLERVHNSDVIDSTSSFELRVLEGALVSISVSLDMQLHRLSAAVEAVLEDLTSKVVTTLCYTRTAVDALVFPAL